MFECSAKHMEDPKSSAQTDKQSQADPEAEVAPAAPMSGSPSAQGLAKQTTTTIGGARDGEGPVSAEAGSATMPKAMSGSAGPSGAETVVASEAVDVTPSVLSMHLTLTLHDHKHP